MAVQLELVKRQDFTADDDVLDLLSYTDGLNLAMEGWIPQPSNDDGVVSEALTLRAQSADDDDLAAITQALKTKKRETKYYKDDVDKLGIWIRAQLSGETYARQALLDQLSYQWNQSIYRPNRKDLERLILGFDRYPWEDTNYTTINGNAVSSIGGTFTISGNAGDMPSRLARVDLVETGGSTMWKYWLGFRGERFGTPANFQPYWSLRKGVSSMYDADTTGGTTNNDTTAKDNYKTITTFATDESMIRRAFVQCYDVAASPNDQRGRYQLLLRAKLSAASTEVRIRLLTASYGDYLTPAYGKRVTITSTSWNYYDLGRVSFPSHKMIGGYDYLDHSLLGIAAERVSGAGYLEMDCFVLIPVNEGYVIAESVTPDPLKISVMQYADGRSQAYHTSVNTPYKLAKVQVGGGVPVGDGIGVIAAQQATLSDKTDTVEADIYAYQRWDMLRGADT